MVQSLSVDLLCLKCQQKLSGEKNRSYKSGDTVKCDACGELNDYDRLIEVAQQKVVEMARSQGGDDMTINIVKPDDK